MKKFTQFITPQQLQEALLQKKLTEVPLIEARLSRVFQMVEDDARDFGIVSSFRSENSEQDNQARHDELKKKVRKMGYGYIELRGGYKGDQGEVVELSLMVPEIKKTEIVTLGREFEQHSVMYKNNEDFFYIGTNEEAGIGKVLMKFHKGAGQDNFELAKHKVIEFFSSLKKASGSGKDRKFVFKAKPTPEPKPTASSSKPSQEKKASAGHKSGDVWKTSSGIWGAKDSGGNFEYFEDKDKANKYAKKHRAGVKIQEREEWCLAKAAYLRRGESPKWLTIYED